MGKDGGDINISEEEGELLQETIEPEEEEKKSYWRKIVVTIIIILLLLLLFWPVPKGDLRKIRSRTRKERPPKGVGVIGATKYKVISGAPMPEISKKRRKAVPVGVWIEVENLSRRKKILDHSMVELMGPGAKGGYAIDPLLVDKWYRENGLPTPWGERVDPGRKTKALAIFHVYRGPVKTYTLRGRDFGFTSDKYTEVTVGAFNTLGDYY